MPSLNSLKVVGVHQVVPTPEELREALRWQCGSKLVGEELARAESEVREYFGGLYLLEMEVDPSDAEIDWISITQPITDQPRANWQVPYDERNIGNDDGRWIFFFHFLDLTRPLSTEIGDVVLPKPTAMPDHLSSVVYEVPG